MLTRIAGVRGLLSAVALLLISACTNVPTAELRIFRESVTAANSAAMPILDEASRTERRIKQFDIAAEPGAPKFEAKDAAYFADLGDAPGTEFLRRGHKVLDSLSEVLLGLATGTGAAADVGALENLASQISGLLGLITSTAPPVAGVFAIIKPGLEELSKELSRKRQDGSFCWSRKRLSFRT